MLTKSVCKRCQNDHPEKSGKKIWCSLRNSAWEKAHRIYCPSVHSYTIEKQLMNKVINIPSLTEIEKDRVKEWANAMSRNNDSFWPHAECNTNTLGLPPFWCPYPKEHRNTI